MNQADKSVFTMLTSIKRIFINGIKAFLPAAITLSLCVWLFHTIEDFFSQFIKLFLPEKYYISGMGIALGVIIIFLLGLMINAFMVKQLYQLLERLLKQIPLVKTLYNALLDMLNFFDSQKPGAQKQKVVVVQTHLGKQIGLITKENLDDLPNQLGDKQNVLVFLPFSYQLGGFMVSMPRDQIETINMTVDEAVTFVASAGIVYKRGHKGE
jgi:uncharacterized membrane protein